MSKALVGLVVSTSRTFAYVAVKIIVVSGSMVPCPAIVGRLALVASAAGFPSVPLESQEGVTVLTFEIPAMAGSQLVIKVWTPVKGPAPATFAAKLPVTRSFSIRPSFPPSPSESRPAGPTSSFLSAAALTRSRATSASGPSFKLGRLKPKGLAIRSFASRLVRGWLMAVGPFL